LFVYIRQDLVDDCGLAGNLSVIQVIIVTLWTSPSLIDKDRL
jgi:hypothetical protein